MTYVFDMDGTLADLYGVPSWCERITHEDVTPYAQAAPLVPLDLFRALIAKAHAMGDAVAVVSWNCGGASDGYARKVDHAKRCWLVKYGLDIDSVDVVPYGTCKSDIIEDDDAILFDDNALCREEWEGAGRIAHVAEGLCMTMLDIMGSR